MYITTEHAQRVWLWFIKQVNTECLANKTRLQIGGKLMESLSLDNNILLALLELAVPCNSIQVSWMFSHFLTWT